MNIYKDNFLLMNLISSYLKEYIFDKKSINSMMLKVLNQVSFSHILREGNSV